MSMDSSKFIKYTLLTIFLTYIVYPRPLCTNQGSSCSFESLFSLFSSTSNFIFIFKDSGPLFDLLIIALISICTIATIYRKYNDIPNFQSIKNDEKIKIILFCLLIWITFMIIFSVPYYYYSRYINSNCGMACV